MSAGLGERSSSSMTRDEKKIGSRRYSHLGSMKSPAADFSTHYYATVKLHNLLRHILERYNPAHQVKLTPLTRAHHEDTVELALNDRELHADNLAIQRRLARLVLLPPRGTTRADREVPLDEYTVL